MAEVLKIAFAVLFLVMIVYVFIKLPGWMRKLER